MSTPTNEPNPSMDQVAFGNYGRNRQEEAREKAILAGILEYCRQMAEPHISPAVDADFELMIGHDLIEIFHGLYAVNSEDAGAIDWLEEVLLQHYDEIQAAMYRG